MLRIIENPITPEQEKEFGPDNPEAWSLMQSFLKIVDQDKVDELEIDDNFESDSGIGGDDHGLYAFGRCTHDGSKYFVQVRKYGKNTN